MRFVEQAAVATGLFLALSDVSAGEVPASETNPCKTQRTTVEMVQCASLHFESADQRLNASYKALRGTLDDQGKTLLRDAQRAWILFRDAECLRERDLARGGTMAPILGLGCKAGMTLKRVEVMERSMRGLESPADTVFWQNTYVSGRFNCRDLSVARLGLAPGFDPERGQATWTAVVKIDEQRLEFPIGGDGQNALAAAPNNLEVSYLDDACPGLRLDDGMTDAISIHWDQKQGAYLWDRR